MICYIGGGYKCQYCVIDFCCNDKDGVNVKVVYIEYDFNCIVCIVLLYYFDGEKCYIFVLVKLKQGDIVELGVGVDIKLGNNFLLKNIFIGIVIYVIEFCFGGGVKMVCLVGVFVCFVVKDGFYVQLCLFLGEICNVDVCCCVIIGEVGNVEQLNINWGKVGCMCWKGVCLIVCGVVMNLVDYLYGGGEGKMFGGCYFVFLWGQVEGCICYVNKESDKYIVCCCNVGKKCKQE